MISILGWMIDPVVCSRMTMGTARVDLAALIELNSLVTGGDWPALGRGGHRVTQEDHDEAPEAVGAASGRQLDLIVKTLTLEGLSDKDRKTSILTLACLLVQAAGLAVEELKDDQH